MKLHLPKRLLTALLATFSVVTSFSTTAWAGWGKVDAEGNSKDADTYYLEAVTTPSISSVAVNATNLFIRTDNVADYKTATINTLELGDGQTMNIDGSWDDSTKEFDVLTLENVQVNTGASNLHVSAANSLNLNAVSGEGTLNLSVDGTLSFGPAFNSSLGAVTNNQTGTINIASDYAGSTTGAIANSGTIVLQQGSGDGDILKLVDKSPGKYNPSVVTNTSTGNIVIDSTEHKYINGDYITISNGGKVTLKGGTFGTQDSVMYKGIFLDNTVLAFENIEAHIGKYHKGDGTVVSRDVTGQWEVGSGAIVYFTDSDVFTWQDNLNLKVLTGGVLNLQKRQSVAKDSSIVLAGGMLCGAGSNDAGDSDYYGLDIFSGGTITTSENSRIETNIGGHLDAAIKFDVASDKTLTMTGDLVGKGSNSFEKSGDGVMVYSGNVFEQSLTISGGVFEYNIADAAEERTHSASISGAGTLRKSGDGTLTLSSANTTVANLAVTVGKLVYNVAEGEKTHSLSGTGGTFEKTGAGTLNLGALNDYSYTGGLTVSEGKVVFTGSETADNETTPSFVNLVKGLETAGDSFVEIQGSVDLYYSGESAADCVPVNIGANLQISENVRFNSRPSGEAPDGDSMRRWNVNEGGNLSVGGYLWLSNMQKMVINGGSVSADGGVILGHEENAGTGSYLAKLLIEDGALSTSKITFNGGRNELLMSDGELTFTPGTDGDDVLTGGSGTNRFTVSGGTLKATDTGWALTGTNVHAVSLGNATFDIAANKTVTLSGDIALTGALTVTGDGELKLGASTFTTNTSVLNGLSYVCDEIDAAQNGMSTIRYQVLTGDGTVSQPEATSVSVSVVDSSFNYTWDNGDIVGHDSAFVINTNFSTADASAENGATMADTFVVNKTGIFTIAGDITGGKTAEELVTCTLGTGTMVLATDATMSDGGRVKFAGTLELATSGTLTLGKTGNNLTEYPTNLSSLNALNLNGGTLKMYYVAPQIKSMTVETASTINIDDVWSNKQTAKADATLIDSLQLDADLTMDTNWKSNVNIGVLSGAANLTAKQTQSNERNKSKLWIDGVDNYTGTISLSGKMALTLNIGDKQSLNASQLSVGSGSTATLTGSGEYNLGATTSLGSGVSLSGDSWTGTVRIHGNGGSQGGLNLNNLSNEKSAVELINAQGWFGGNGVTMAGNLILTADEAKNAAWSINDGSSSSSSDSGYDTFTMATFKGSVSGNGTMKYIWSGGSGYTGYTFSGDLSGWTGVFDQSVGKKRFNLLLTGDADTVNAEIKRSADNAELHLHVNTDEAATFSKTVNVTKLTLKQSVGFSSGTENTVAGELNIATEAGKTISLTNDTTLNVTGGLTSDYGLSITGGAGTVSLSGADNTIGGDLSIANGNSLTLAKDSKLTVNSPIQNGGNLDIKGTVHWNLTSASGLTTAFDPGELTERTTNGLGKGLVNGLVTGSGTLVDNGIIGATYNGAQAQYNTATGQAIIDNAIYYVVAPKNDTESSDNRYYVLDSDKNVYLRDVINVGNHKFDTTDGPIPDTEANQALGYYVAKGGTLCVSGDSSDSGLTAGQILQNTYGDGDVILRNPGYEHSTGHIPLEAIVTGEIKSTGNLYLNPFVLTEGVITYATVNHLTYVTLTLKDNADISSFNSINFGYQGTRIRVEGAIGADEDGHHLNNVSTLGSSDVEIFLLTDANEELVLGGTTTVQSHVYYPEESGHTGSHLNLCLNHDSAIRIEHLSDGGDPDAKEKATLVISSKGSEVNPIKDNVVAEVNIDSFDFRGGIQIDGSQLESQANGFITVNITLQENQWIEDIQCRSKYYQWAEQEVYLNFKGVGTYVLSDGSDIFVNPQSTNTIYLNFGKLSEEVDNQGNHIWQGTVQVNRLDGVSNGRGIDFRFFGNEQSTVDFRGFVGPVVSWNDEGAVNTALPDSVIIEPKLILTNVEAEGDDKQAMNAYEVTGGIKEQNYTGDISGDGDFVVSAADGMTFNLQGNVSEWKDGAELKVTNGTHNVNFSNAATEINADVLATGGTMNATISNAAAVNVHGKVAADGGTLNLSVNTAQGTTFTNNVEVTKLAVGSDSTAKLQATSSAGNIQIDSYGKDKVATLSNGLTMAGDVVSSGYIADAMITQLQKQGSVELQDVTASNLYLYGEGVKFHSTDTKNQFTFDRQISYGNERVNEVVFTSDIFSGMILSEDGAQLTLTVNNAVVWGNAEQPDWTNVTIKLNGFTIEQLAGKAGDWYWDKFGLSIEAVGAETAMLAAAGLSTTVTDLLNADYQFVEYVQDEYGLTIRMYNTPEPTTATLSMLALAALAARRRRRK